MEIDATTLGTIMGSGFALGLFISTIAGLINIIISAFIHWVFSW